MMEIKTVLLDSLAVERALKRISHEIIENNKGVSNVVLLGIAKGGVPVAEKLAKCISEIEKTVVPCGKLDITCFRDDLKKEKNCLNLENNKIPFSIENKDVILCDDVLYTGRTVRAGIEAVIANGRPKSIQLAVLIDRGHKELPIRADYVGKNVPTSRDEKVIVSIKEDNTSASILKNLE